MKKTMLAILILAISVATTSLNAVTIHSEENKFFSPKPYHYNSWYKYFERMHFQFLHTTEDNKTYFRIKQMIKGKAIIGTNDYIIVIFQDGREYRLDYCTEPLYKGYYSEIKEDFKNKSQIIITDDYTEVEAMAEIGEFTNIDKIIFIKNGFDFTDSNSISSNCNENLLILYMTLMSVVNMEKEK